jgi:hypothetical protein
MVSHTTAIKVIYGGGKVKTVKVEGFYPTYGADIATT